MSVTGKAPLISVLTATYNGAETLARLYESLSRQTLRDIEWVVVDDGSEDETEGLVRSWIDAHELDIQYKRQSNQGKHVAVNRAVEMARGTLATIIDSDDRYVPTALERFAMHWAAIPDAERDGFAGVRALCADEDGRIIGDRYPVDPLDCSSSELTHVHGVRGDKPILARMDVLREFPFPFEHVHGLVTEALVWHRIGLKYRERHVNEVLVIVEYRHNGLSARARELLIQSAVATRQYFLEEAALPHRLPRAQRVRSYANYVRYSIHAGIGIRRQLRDAPSKGMWIVSAPVGLALYLRDRRRLARRARRPSEQ